MPRLVAVSRHAFRDASSRSVGRASRLSTPVAVAALTAGLLVPTAGAAWAADGADSTKGVTGSGSAPAAAGPDGWAGHNLVGTGDTAPAVPGTAAAQRLGASAAAAVASKPRGIDVSRYQSSSTLSTCSGSVQVGWVSVRASGRSFAFIKASGSRAAGTFEDPCFDRNWAGARAAGLYRGAYHYAIPSNRAGSAAADARFFVKVTGNLQEPGTLPPVLDLEATGGLGKTQLRAWAATWLTTVRALTGRQPILYTGPYFWTGSVAGGASFADYPLWIARYASAPSVPAPWRTWTFWQSSASGRVPGVAGPVDVDTFNGTAAQLKALAHPGTVPTAAASAAVVYGGQPWTLTGTLRSTTGALVRSAVVTLYRRATGASTWTRVATARTHATTAAYRFDLRPTAAASYQVRYAGGRDFAASASAVLSHAFSARVPSALTSTVSAARVARRQPVQLSGVLRTTPSAAAVPGAAVTVYRKAGSGPWTAVRRVTTAATGGYRTTLRPVRTAVYKAVYAGSATTLPAGSPVRTITVR